MDQNSSNNPPNPPSQPQAAPPPLQPETPLLAQNAPFFAPTVAAPIPAPIAAPPTPPPTLPLAPPPQLQSIDALANMQAAPIPAPTPTQPPVEEGNTKTSRMDTLKQWLPKIVIMIVILVIVAELVIYAPKIMSIFGRGGAETTESIIKPPGSSLAVTASKSEFQVGESFKVSVVLDTNNANIQSADAVLKFNPAYLEADTAQGIVTGKVFSSFPVAVIDNASGVVRISGTNGVSKSGFTGIGELATLTFKAKAPGEAAINIDYVPNGTADSNVIDLDGTQDVLKVIEGLSLTIK